MEIMAVVVIVGIMAVFAIPNFSKTVEKSHEQDAVTQLIALHGANEVYRAQNGVYWPPDDLTGDTVAKINAALGLNLIESGMTYLCITNGLPYGQTYYCRATRVPSGSFMVTVTQAPLSTGNPLVTNITGGSSAPPSE